MQGFRDAANEKKKRSESRNGRMIGVFLGRYIGKRSNTPKDPHSW